MLKNKTIAVIGAGHMGSALIGGMLKAKLVDAKRIRASRRSPQALAELKKRWGVQVCASNLAAARGADILLLCVKPQTAPAVLQEIAPAVTDKQLAISVMAGITTDTVASLLGKPLAVVRAMPNTPAQVDEGATALSKGAHASDADLRVAEAIFKAVGKVELLPESLLNAATGLSGSGPVYIYMVIEALTDGGVKMGIPRDIARRLAAQTVFGAAKMVLETGKHPAILKDEVTTPGGTAIAAIHELESKGLRTVLIDAVVTATRRAQELSGG
ncbi:MAG TPA: pyrroline-5-carboxylate reductase [Elusimicrobiota bacterium]|jgi:pyrroline-5-carboxylate reductase|nr:pyrroline-5-carboxylate reductase [Elusimicrobiota bacterium]